jgi:F-type H+-transporting ATPase subunit a
VQHEESVLSKIVNPLLEKWFGIHASDYIIMATFVVLAASLLFTALKRLWRPDNFSSLQQTVEIGVQFIRNLLKDYVGSSGIKYQAMVGTIGIYVLFCNLLGSIPGFTSPTSNINVTAGIALITFFYYNISGIKALKARYVLQFTGTNPFMAVLLTPIEMISHVSRPLSLSLRLFGNIFGDHTLAAVFFSLLPVLLPIPLLGLGLFVAGIQAYVFVLLTTIYISLAVHIEH